MTPVNRGPSSGASRGESPVLGSVVFALAAVAFGGVIFWNVNQIQQLPPNRPRNPQPDPPAPEPWGWERGPKAAAALQQQEEDARRKLAADRNKFQNMLNEKEQQVHTFTTDATYRDAVALATALSRDHTPEANR